MKFTFSLDTVLQVRKQQEKVQQQALAGAIAEKRDLSRQKRKLQDRLEELFDKMNRGTLQDMRTLKQYQKQVQQLHGQLKEAHRGLREAEENVQKQRGQLAGAYKKRHIMENLKEAEQQNFLNEQAKQEQKVMDEIAIQKFSAH